MIESWSRLSWIRHALEALVVGAACLSLAPLDTRTVFTAASDYVRTTAFGTYDKIVFSQVHRRPFEMCPGVEVLHAQSLQRVEGAIAGIEASSRFEPVRLLRLVRLFNREAQTFYSSECAQAWTYYYYYAEYQSFFMKVVPIIWVIDVLHRSEIYLVVLAILGSWFGIVCLFCITKSLSRSSVIGFASLAILWFSVSPSGPSLQYTDFRLNLFNTFALVGIAQFLCDMPPVRGWFRAWALEGLAALVFALYALLLIFFRLPPTRLDAMVVIASVFAVAAVGRNWDIFRRAVLLFALVTSVQWPYQQFSASLLGPVSAVNTAASDEFKPVNVVQYVNERPSHFGNFILDFNNSWIHDGDYYLRQLSPTYAFHHGYPPWGRHFLIETLFRHPTELPNAWWKRFAVQIVFHKDLSYGIYGGHATLGTAVVWLALGVGFIVLLGGQRSSSAWPLIGLIFWEIFGLHTLLALMHVHNMYLLKGLPLLWCTLPCLAVVAVRGAPAWLRPSSQTWTAWRLPRGRRLAPLAAAAAVLLVAGAWVVREFRKEVHVTHIWRAVHAGLIDRAAFRTPTELAREIEALRALGGEAPGTVSMYGAWALFGYLERLGSYTALTGQPISAYSVKQLMFQYYKRALVEGPENPHFYSYARYFGDPAWPIVFEEALRRFPEHPYGVMMTWALLSEVPTLDRKARDHYRSFYDESVRAQLRASESFRPGLRAVPSLTAKGPVVATAEGMLTSLLPGEILSVEPFKTFSTDRLSIGVFLRVTEGQLTGQLLDARGARLADLPVMSPSDDVAYRAWHFENLGGNPPSRVNSQARLALVGGPQGARFVIRDLYPLVENPRWFR